MILRWNQLKPGSELIEQLEFLQAEGLALRNGMLNTLSEYGFEAGEMPEIAEGLKYELANKFKDLIRDKECRIGPVMVTRILLAGVPKLYTSANASLTEIDQPTGRPEDWVGAILVNIERELERIDAKRMLWITVSASAVAAVAAIITAIALIVSAIQLFVSLHH